MLSAFVIMFREMLEMSMVLGVLFVVTRPVPSARRWIYIGSIIGLAGASFVAAFMHEMENSLQGAGEMWFNAVVLALASVMIGWTVVWMSRHGRELSMRMQSVGQAVSVGELPQTALMMVALAAVLREGSEVVLFLYGIAAAGGSGPAPAGDFAAVCRQPGRLAADVGTDRRVRFPARRCAISRTLPR